MFWWGTQGQTGSGPYRRAHNYRQAHDGTDGLTMVHMGSRSNRLAHNGTPGPFRWTHERTDRLTSVQTDSWVYRQTHKRTDRFMSVQTDSWPYRQIHNRTDGLNKVQTAKRMDSALFRIKRPDSRSYRGTLNRKKGLRIKWKDLYGRTQKRTDGLGIVRTDSELYGHTRKRRDGLGIVRTDLELQVIGYLRIVGYLIG